MLLARTNSESSSKSVMAVAYTNNRICFDFILIVVKNKCIALKIDPAANTLRN
jgi:hypothetical protein